ncbi:hypothetical protein EVAR_14680_1 [Eumeta japonica]|uniref:Uncharacterized protein n=1 Tax=Eumeta variegata TaxID=151549 RepID=A0A4C1U294_EUMVA|nr:hypothetical protein EVAR_14680_1 [Eumeta japonica]
MIGPGVPGHLRRNVGEIQVSLGTDYSSRMHPDSRISSMQTFSTFWGKAPSKISVCHRFSEFNCGRSMLTDEFKEGRPKSVVPQNIDAVRELIMQDRHVIHRKIKTSLSTVAPKDMEQLPPQMRPAR